MGASEAKRVKIGPSEAKRLEMGASEAKRPTGAERAGEAASERRCRGVRGAKPLG